MAFMDRGGAICASSQSVSLVLVAVGALELMVEPSDKDDRCVRQRLI